MFADYGAESPLWDERGTMVWLDQLPLSEGLRQDLSVWASRADKAQWDEVNEWGRGIRQVPEMPENLVEGPYVEIDPQIRQDGLALWHRVQDELGSSYQVEWMD